MDRSKLKHLFRLKTNMCLGLLLLSIQIVLSQQRPNIIIILSDDHSFQSIGAYNNEYKNTPNIDKLAQQGMRFNKGYVTNSLCGPSRAAILTGKYSHKNNFKDNDNSVFDFSQDSFIKQLFSSGYQTAWIGKMHLESKPEGFSHYDILDGQGQYFNPDFISKEGSIQVHGYVSDIITSKSKDWINKQVEPFCLIIGHKAPHRNWLPDPKDFGVNDTSYFPIPNNFFDKFEGRKSAQHQEMSIANHLYLDHDLKLFDSEEEMRKDYTLSRLDSAQFSAYATYYLPIAQKLKKDRLTGQDLAVFKFQRYMIDYMNTVQSMDRNIGELMQYLDDQKLSDNTLLIYLSDQGFFMGEHGWYDKRWMYEQSFRTPLIVRFPKKITANTTSNQTVLNLDVAATALDYASIQAHPKMESRSFRKILEGNNEAIRDIIYYHYYENTIHKVSPQFGISDGRFKLIRFYERVNDWEFYDLDNDPNEMKNLFSDKKYQKQIKKFKIKLKQEIIRLDDQEALKIFETKF